MTPHPAFLSPFETAVADAPASDAASAKKKKTKGALRLRIDGEWYDCTGWAKAHPGGSLFITLMDGCDATDVFYALHSYGPNGDDLAARRLAMLPRCDGPEEEEEEEEEEEGGREIAAPSIVRNPNHTIETKPGNADANFATLRKKFEDEGWFARDPLKEASVLCQVLGLYALGWFLAWTHPILASLSLGLGMQQAGWLAHDYIHGRGKWCTMMRGFGSLTNGFSTEWWQHKHNMHHSFTNIDGRDGDIKLEPLYYLQDPKVTGRNDNPGLRKWQHWYGYPLYAATYALWRRHSMASAIARRDKKELTLLGIHYAWLFLCLPWQVAVSSVLIGGFLVGSLVTATHQTEEIMFEQGGEFVDIQFRSTREADVKGLEAWLWGGMDTQLVHHLFPTMPRYRHHEARPVIRKWAEEHGYDFRISSSWEILSKNFNHLKELAHI
tara:strand:- start:671 stop:1987 length:1317 start_codon:yes stop_codon:yes gene_type:complete